MIAYFPEIYPDELVYSVLSRCYEHSGFLYYIHAAEQFFANSRDRQKHEFLNAYTEQIDALLTAQKTHTKLVFENTMFPYYARFLPYERRNIALNALLKKSSDYYNKISYTMKKSPAVRHLRYCPVCVECDRHQYGETYWHRMHQMMGIDICPAHHCFLLDSTVEISSKASPSFYSAEECISSLEVRESGNDVQIRLAEYVSDVFQADVNMENETGVGEFLNSRLVGTPYLSVRGKKRDMEALTQNFRLFYQELPDNWFGALDQIQHLLNGKRSNMVEVCMLAMFLGVGVKELVEMKMPDKNATAEYDRRITELKARGLNYRKIAEMVGGGYSYIKEIGEKRNRRW